LDFVGRGAPGERLVRTLVALGDSTTVGLGDPVPGGGWRGFGPLLAGALGGPEQVHFANLSFTGARARCVRTQQLPLALRLRPDAAVLVVGMNDTLRSDFDPVRIHEHLDSVVGRLVDGGAVVVTVRYHDHGRIFRLPGPLHRVLRRRIEQVNEAIDTVVARHGAQCLDLHTLPRTYDLAVWGVDRLHPSELGHRVLARGFGELLTRAGCAVPEPVSLDCSGGMRITPLHHVAWLLLKGIPWLCKRGVDLLPHGIAVMTREIIATRRERKAQRARRRVHLVDARDPRGQR
jgi:lysophospholipase L1-like esterase